MPDKYQYQHFVQFPLLMHWIKERYSIYIKRSQQKPKPWTDDPILQRYRFCNVYRELDKVTVWISDNWRSPNADDPDLWFAMLVARYINEPGTMELMGYPVPYRSANFIDAVQQRKREGKNAFNAAYIISTGGLTLPKHEYLDMFFKRMWNKRKQLRVAQGMNLRNYCELLVNQPGIGRFMAGQIIADLKYANPILKEADDWWSFAISGPGSRRGMNRMLGRPVKQNWNEGEWFAELRTLRLVVNQHLPENMPNIHGQDLQNCLCEFDKYCRAKFGEGKPKQKFNGV